MGPGGPRYWPEGPQEGAFGNLLRADRPIINPNGSIDRHIQCILRSVSTKPAAAQTDADYR